MTITELLLAGVAGGIVLTVAGSSLFQLMVQNKNINNQIDTRTSVSQVVDFVKYESKQVLKFEYTDSTTLANVAPTFVADVLPSLPADASAPLAMNIPSLSEPVIYYVATPPSNSIWRGPLVLYRWGPMLNDSGEYLDPQNASNWSTEPLIDTIDDTALTPNCPNGWTANPSSNAVGFYTCISSDQKASQIHLNGEIQQAVTNNNNHSHGDERTLVSMIYDPSSVASSPTPMTSNLVTAPPPPSLDDLDCEVVNGILSCGQPATVTMEIVGDEYACGSRIPILTQFIVDGTENPTLFRANDANYESSIDINVAPSTEIAVKSIRSSGSCGAGDRQTDNPSDQPFIRALRDGDSVPSTAGWNGQQSVETYLQEFTDANGNISLDDNQIIYLFEMYTSTTGGTYDLQDNVVLATVAPQ